MNFASCEFFTLFAGIFWFKGIYRISECGTASWACHSIIWSSRCNIHHGRVFNRSFLWLILYHICHHHNYFTDEPILTPPPPFTPTPRTRTAPPSSKSLQPPPRRGRGRPKCDRLQVTPPAQETSTRKGEPSKQKMSQKVGKVKKREGESAPKIKMSTIQNVDFLRLGAGVWIFRFCPKCKCRL